MSRKKYHIFCDESCLSNRYSCYSGIIIENCFLEKVKNTILNSRKENNLYAEIKWSKISNQYEEKYINLIKAIESLINKDIMHFRSIIIDNHKINHKKYNDNNKEIGLYKFYYQLLKHCFLKDINQTAEINVYIDKRITHYSLDDLKDCLNCTKDLAFCVIKTINHIDSKKCDFIQVNDLLLGALSFHKNGNHKIDDTRISKVNIASFIAQSIAGTEILGECTPRRQKRFKVWNINFK